ncbi:zinc metalloproteinase nas-9-like [Pectinophora gossypiella]|uniref:zinc metalloproteinase nas-9-like n=1 Tax=Pectinophora gossypiella TaxID=13191 RepID=UPI00214EB127|nr:zinc metalloproteinase nas-9-like [Pectinophora gossypiella]
MLRILTIALYLGCGHSALFSKGIVHYIINQTDYDPHSQSVISSTFVRLQRELCLKFFQTPPAYNQSMRLVVRNRHRTEDCQPAAYNFTGGDVEMTVGYKCINPADIARITVDMLRASIDSSDVNVNSFDLTKQYQEKEREPNNLLTRADRNHINSHYTNECESLVANPVPRRRMVDMVPIGAGGDNVATNMDFYQPYLWPLGLVMYGVNEDLLGAPGHYLLKKAMTVIEQDSCVVFQYHADNGALAPNSLLWFSVDGEPEPAYGFQQKNQSINLARMTHGAPGHEAHVLNNLLRALGVPMMSNRYDRDNYVQITWRNVVNGREHLLEKMPEEAWMPQLPYDFNSATHAPANYECGGCRLGETTVHPLQDKLWQRLLMIGHATALSRGDIKMLQLLYSQECEKRNAAVHLQS